MSLKSTLIDLGVLAACAAIAFGIGFAKGDSDGLQSGNAKILAAQQNEQTAQDNAKKDHDALQQLGQQLAVQKQAMLVAQRAASAALDQRDKAQSQLQTATTARISAERKLAHETPACADLEHMPICPDLSRRLWGEPAETPAANAGNNDH